MIETVEELDKCGLACPISGDEIARYRNAYERGVFDWAAIRSEGWFEGL